LTFEVFRWLTSVQIGDVFALTDGLGGKEYDLVFCYRLIIHLPYKEKAIRNLYDAASKSCFVILDVTDRTYAQRIMWINEDTGEQISYYFRKVSLTKIKEIAGQIASNYWVVAGPGPYSSLILHKEH
jgi:2-polyprenyl-3-methyl-5-hydroxy-6-metoxy-1,4-benzoquinol methylase